VQSERQTHPNPRPFVTLLVDACVHGGVTAAGIFWSTAATLTLAALLENAGRRVGLLAWDCSETALGSQTGGYLPHAWTVMLKHYAEPWQVQDVICTTNQAFLRRLMFRLNEASPLGAREGYGNVPSAQWKTRTLQALAAAYGWPCLLIGANPSHDRIDRMESALAWVTKQLTTLEAA
jgi:hypothetical protein